MFTNSLLLVPGEATRSLDGNTESDFTDDYQGIRGSVIVALAAYGQATLRTVKSVIFLLTGRLAAAGTFDEVARMIPGIEE